MKTSPFEQIAPCPDCGRDEWEEGRPGMNLKPGEYCCTNCGSVYSLEELEARNA